MEQMKMYFHLEESSSLPHNCLLDTLQSCLHNCSSAFYQTPPECVAASVYLTSNDGCSLFILQRQVLQHRVGQVLWEGRRLTKGGSM